MNGLVRRLDTLERVATTQYTTRHDVGEALMQKIFEQADRMRVTPPGPIENQSIGERCIRGALADAEGAETGQEYAQSFWASFRARMQQAIRDHA